MPAKKRTVWMCVACGEYTEEKERYGSPCCDRQQVERHSWICSECTAAYPGNRRLPERCEECGETLR